MKWNEISWKTATYITLIIIQLNRNYYYIDCNFSICIKIQVMNLNTKLTLTVNSLYDGHC